MQQFLPKLFFIIQYFVTARSDLTILYSQYFSIQCDTYNFERDNTTIIRSGGQSPS